MIRFFRATPDVYDELLARINSAWELPRNGQASAFAPLNDAPQAGGFVYLAAYASDCDLEPIASMLPAALASGAVEVVSEAAYFAALPNPWAHAANLAPQEPA